MAREYFAAYHSYLKAIEPLGEAARGRLFTACLNYSKTGALPKLKGSERFVWPSMRDQIDRDKKNYDARCALNRKNGALGAAAKATKRSKTPKAGERPQTPPKEKEKAKEKAKTNENTLSYPDGQESAGADAPGAAKPRNTRTPTVEEIKEYCRENGYALDAEHFFEHYESVGWRVGNSPIKDWRARVRIWVRKDAEQVKAPGGRAPARAGRHDGRIPIEHHDFTDEQLGRLLVDLDAPQTDADANEQGQTTGEAHGTNG